MAKKKTIIQEILGTEVEIRPNLYAGNMNLPIEGTEIDYTPDMIKELKRCREDIVYFAENYFFINGHNGKEIISLFPKQEEVLRSLANNKYNLLLTSRQWSKTTLMTIVALWSAMFYADTSVMIVANKLATALEVMQRIRLAYQEMDLWIKQPLVDEFNKQTIRLSNNSVIECSATSPDAIRGKSIDVLILDEFGIIKDPVGDDFWAACAPTLTTRIDKKKHARAIVASTPKGVNNKFFRLYDASIKGDNDFVIHKAMWYDVPDRDESFKLKEIATLGSLELFEQEYECRFLQSSDSTFAQSLLSEIKEGIMVPTIIKYNEAYRVYYPYEENHLYVMGVDSAGGGGGNSDYSVAQVLDVTDMQNIQQVAQYRSNIIDHYAYATVVNDLAKEWARPPMMVERNNMGVGVIARLVNDFLYPRLFRYNAVSSSYANLDKTVPGLYTNNNTKMAAISLFRYFLATTRVLHINDEDSYNEIASLSRVYRGSNSYYVSATGHDDCFMALVMATACLHKDVVRQFFHVLETNEDKSPLVLQASWKETGYTPIKGGLYEGMSGDMLPIFFNSNRGYGVVHNPHGGHTFEALLSQGWSPLHL